MKKFLVVAVALVVAGSAMAFTLTESVDNAVKEVAKLQASGKSLDQIVKQAVADGLPLSTLYAALSLNGFNPADIVQDITADFPNHEQAGEQAVRLAVAGGASLTAMQQAAIAGGADPTQITVATAAGGTGGTQVLGGGGGTGGGNNTLTSQASSIGGSGTRAASQN